ncbi:hypothetical protein CAPTEDRAFT_202944 [Capitella teleta]|uniref:Uncharacterized protein n=1 Tax=Capitella teleta TaxID=283909 RepID=R7U0P8_CAPTE|nr:hypothetical protein CAPTEDRAFT_202944 [Capitella teleta]|eukprot:ELT99432.1 hypothetical protein CAPTEDRAFT_202944 [Capitella teleta]
MMALTGLPTYSLHIIVIISTVLISNIDKSYLKNIQQKPEKRYFSPKFSTSTRWVETFELLLTKCEPRSFVLPKHDIPALQLIDDYDSLADLGDLQQNGPEVYDTGQGEDTTLPVFEFDIQYLQRYLSYALETTTFLFQFKIDRLP